MGQCGNISDSRIEKRVITPRLPKRLKEPRDLCREPRFRGNIWQKNIALWAEQPMQTVLLPARNSWVLPRPNRIKRRRKHRTRERARRFLRRIWPPKMRRKSRDSRRNLNAASYFKNKFILSKSMMP